MSRFGGGLCASVVLAATVLCQSTPPHDSEPVFTTRQLDLSRYGFDDAQGGRAADCSGLNFLSEDLLLISVVQRTFYGGAQPTFVDTPNSQVILFNIATGNVLSRTEMSVEKWPDAIQPLTGKRFVVWNKSGIQVCASDFSCGNSIEARQLFVVSPQGTRAVISGQLNRQGGEVNGWGKLKVVDLASLKEVAIFDVRLPDRSFQKVIPGDGSLLISNLKYTVVRRPGKADQNIRFNGRGTFERSRFLNAITFAYFDWDQSQSIVANLDGKELYRIPVERVWQSGFLPTLDGIRFGSYEYGYTWWNSVLNFMDIDQARPSDFQRVRIFDTKSGLKIAEFEWDPRPYLVRPALSPGGHKLARVRGRFLEILSAEPR